MKKLLKRLTNNLFFNQEGFTLTETIFSIVLMLLLSVSVFYMMTAIFKNAEIFSKKNNDALVLLKVDEQFRNEIKNTSIKYYENPEIAAEILFVKLQAIEFEQRRLITKMQILYDKKNRVRGAEIFYKLANMQKEYCTKELFKIIPLELL